MDGDHPFSEVCCEIATPSDEGRVKPRLGARARREAEGKCGLPLRDPQPPHGTAILGPAAEAPPGAESSAPARGGSGGSAPSGASPRRRHRAASPRPRLPAPQSRRRLDGSGAEPRRAACPPRPDPTHALRGGGMGLRGGGGRAGGPAPGWTCLLLCAALRSLLASPGSEGERRRGGRGRALRRAGFCSIL